MRREAINSQGRIALKHFFRKSSSRVEQSICSVIFIFVSFHIPQVLLYDSSTPPSSGLYFHTSIIYSSLRFLAL